MTRNIFPRFRSPPYAIRAHLGNHHKFEKDPYEQVRYVEDYFVYGVDKEKVSIISIIIIITITISC